MLFAEWGSRVWSDWYLWRKKNCPPSSKIKGTNYNNINYKKWRILFPGMSISYSYLLGLLFLPSVTVLIHKKYCYIWDNFICMGYLFALSTYCIFPVHYLSVRMLVFILKVICMFSCQGTFTQPQTKKLIISKCLQFLRKWGRAWKRNRKEK